MVTFINDGFVDDFVVRLVSVLVLDVARVDGLVSDGFMDNFMSDFVGGLVGVLVLDVARLDTMVTGILNDDIMMEVVKGVLDDGVLLHDVVSLAMVLSNGRRLRYDLRVVLNMGSSVMNSRLMTLVVRMFVIHSGDFWLTMKNCVFLDDFVQSVVSILVVAFKRVLVMVGHVSEGRVVNVAILMESMMGVVVVVLSKDIVGVVMDLVSVIKLSVMVKFSLVLDGLMVLLVVMFVALVLGLVIVSVAVLVELRSVVSIMVVRVHVLDVSCVVLDLMTVVGICVEVDGVIIFLSVVLIILMLFVVMLLNVEGLDRMLLGVVRQSMFLNVKLFRNTVVQEVLTIVIPDSHTLSVARHQVSVQIAAVLIEISVSMSGSFSMVLGVCCLVHRALHVEVSVVVEGVGSERW